MLTEKNSVFIRGYKIFRSDGKGRKGVAILINKSLKCDSYKTIQDEEGRYIQIKLKEKDNEITISTAYVEPDSSHNPNILPEFILQSNIFGGDLNKFHSGLKITSNVYHIKNIGELVEKIDVIKKISDHPILVYKKKIPFAKNSKAKKIKIFDKIILKSNRNELEKSILQNHYIPKIKSPIIEKTIPNIILNFDDNNYNEAFEEIKAQNKDKFKLLKNKKAEEISILLKSNKLGHEPYQRLSRLIQYKFDNKFWNDDYQEKKIKIIEGYKSLFGVQEDKCSMLKNWQTI